MKFINRVNLSFALFLVAQSSAQAAVVSRQNVNLGCQSYEVVNDAVDENNEIIPFVDRALAAGAILVNREGTRGFSLENLRVDFDRRLIRVDVLQRIPFGFNRVLVPDAIVRESNPDFNRLINTLNWDFFVASQVCLDTSNEIRIFE